MAKKITPAMRAEIGRLVVDEKKPQAEVAKQFGIHEVTVGRSARAYRKGKAGVPGYAKPPAIPVADNGPMRVNINVSADLQALQAENVTLAARLAASEEEVATLQKVVMTLGRAL